MNGQLKRLRHTTNSFRYCLLFDPKKRVGAPQVLLHFTSMADVDHSSDDTSVDSREDNSQDSKLEFSEDEETLIARMYSLVGDRWSLIAGRIPGRTAEEIEKYWTSRYSSSE